MALAVSDVRNRVSDNPYLMPKPGESPEFLGTGDGTTTSFFLTRNPYTGSALTSGQGLTMWSSSGNNVWTQITTGFTLQNGNQIVFTGAPANGLKIGARYYLTAFSDSELQTILTQAQASSVCSGQGDDVVLYKCQFDAISELLMNRDKLITYHRGDVSDDVITYVDALTKTQKVLQELLFGKNRPGANVPSVVVVSQPYVPYTPQR